MLINEVIIDLSHGHTYGVESYTPMLSRVKSTRKLNPNRIAMISSNG